MRKLQNIHLGKNNSAVIREVKGFYSLGCRILDLKLFSDQSDQRRTFSSRFEGGENQLDQDSDKLLPVSIFFTIVQAGSTSSRMAPLWSMKLHFPGSSRRTVKPLRS